MLKRIRTIIKTQRTEQRLSQCLARAAASATVRNIDPADPLTWQFSGFSQNGEDGIISYLLSRLREPSRYFVEIGASNGLENNTAWLAFGLKYCGLMVEGDPAAVEFCRSYLQRYNWGVTFWQSFVTLENLDALLPLILDREPDVLSLDIDGNDYHIAQRLLTLGLRPKIIAAEYNSAFGPEQAVTIPYKSDFNRKTAHPSCLYYGVSVQALRTLMGEFGYRFVTVDSNGVNAFFVHPEYFSEEFLSSLKGLAFAENFAERRMRGVGWERQYEEISRLPFHKVS